MCWLSKNSGNLNLLDHCPACKGIVFVPVVDDTIGMYRPRSVPITCTFLETLGDDAVKVVNVRNCYIYLTCFFGGSVEYNYTRNYYYPCFHLYAGYLPLHT
jgi:hypothetical protein